MISIIICSVNDARFAAVSRMFAGLMEGESWEIIRISDARSMCEGYARGFARSKGDLLIFCHDDIEILNSDFAARLKIHLSHFDLVGVAGTNRLACGECMRVGPPYIFGQVAQVDAMGAFVLRIFGVAGNVVGGIQAVDGLFFAAQRRVAEQIQFDAETFTHFHHYDLDFSFRAYLAGFKLAIANDIHILHQSWGEHDEKWRESLDRFHWKHASRLFPFTPREWTLAAVHVRTKQELRELMADVVLNTRR